MGPISARRLAPTLPLGQVRADHPLPLHECSAAVRVSGRRPKAGPPHPRDTARIIVKGRVVSRVEGKVGSFMRVVLGTSSCVGCPETTQGSKSCSAVSVMIWTDGKAAGVRPEASRALLRPRGLSLCSFPSQHPPPLRTAQPFLLRRRAQQIDDGWQGHGHGHNGDQLGRA